MRNVIIFFLFNEIEEYLKVFDKKRGGNMICQECKEKEAKVHITKIINGEKHDIYFCEDCAKKKGELNFGIDFSFNNLLTGLLNDGFNSHINLSNNQLECKNCGLKYQEFSRSGRLGCAQCYNYFGEKIDKILRRIHSSNRHTGKIPKRIGKKVRIKRKIEALRTKMDQAVAKEKFEEAAEYRDKIKEIKTGLEE